MKPLDEPLKAAIERGAGFLEGEDLAFFRRVWSTPLDIFRLRLSALAFGGLGHVLDAGCGMGQWSLCLSETNARVTGIDVSAARVQATTAMASALAVRNLEFVHQSSEELRFPDSTFDGIFCYGVLMFCDYPKVVREFRRTLKPGGKVYICTNGLGWYIYNLVTPHNSSATFDARRMASQAIENTLLFLAGLKRLEHIAHFPDGGDRTGGQIVIPSAALKNCLESEGFERVQVGGEGTLALRPSIPVKPFFISTYEGMEAVYELVAWKPGP